MKKFLLVKEKIRILCQILRINIRSSVITLLGLSIALSTITSCLIFLETNKANYYLTLLEEDHSDDRVIYECSAQNIQSFDKQTILALQKALENKISEYELEQLLLSHSLYPICYSTDTIKFLNQSEWNVFYGLIFNETILEDCVEGSYLPTTKNETLLITSSDLALNVGDIFTISLPIDDRTYYDYKLKISGLITPETLRNMSPLCDIFRTPSKFFPYYRNISIITDLGHYLELFSTIDKQILSLTTRFSLSFNLQFRFDLQVSEVTTNNVIKAVSNLISFLKETDDTFSLSDFSLNMLYNWSTVNMIEDVRKFDDFFFYCLFLCIPVFLASILLGRFSLGVIHEQRTKNIVLFRMRGFSRRFLLLTLMMEYFVLALIASFFSIILGIGGAIVISTTTGYLTFNLESLPVILIFPQSLLPMVIIFGVGFTCLTSLRRLRHLITIDLIHLDQKSSFAKTSKPRRFICNIDLFFIIQGLFYFVLLIFIVQIINKNPLDIEYSQILNIFFPIMIFLIILSPLSFFIGFILFYNRFIPKIIHKLGGYFWKKDWSLPATVVRNLDINVKITRHFTLFIACSVSFLMILSSLPISLYLHNTDAIYYNVGADICLHVDHNTVEANQELKMQLNSIEGLNYTTVSRALFTIYDNNGIRHTLFLLGIEDNFHYVAHWRSYYADQSLSELVHSLFNSSKSYPVIIDSNTARRESLTETKTYKPFITVSNSIEFSVESISDYWPRFINEVSSKYHYLITKTSLISNISLLLSNYQTGIFYTDQIWCKVLPKYDCITVANQIRSVTEKADNVVGIDNALSQIKEYSQELSTQLFWIIININFFISIVLILIFIILFSIILILQQKTELGLIRALGMKYHYVFLVVFMEPLILLIISSVPGGVIGLIFLVFFVELYSSLLLPTAPPFILDFHLPALILSYGTIFIAIVVIVIIISFLAIRSNISRILKVE